MMTKQFAKAPQRNIVSYILWGTLVILSSLLLNPVNYYINALILLIAAVGLYFFIVIAVADWNWLDIRATFNAVWLATLGLAALRLNGYQEQWQDMTWILCAVGYLMFQIGANLGIGVCTRHIPKLWDKKPDLLGMHFRFAPNRLFWVCVITTLAGLASFIANVAIKGFIPCFVNDSFAYLDFYTKFHVFSSASTVVCGLCYYCIKTQKLNWVKKLVLWLCILYTLILFPILVVSRGVFVVAALAFTTVVFYLNKRKLPVLILCLAAIMAVYMAASNLRSLTDGQLNVIFDPNTITVSDDEKTPDDSTGEVPVVTPDDSTGEVPVVTPDDSTGEVPVVTPDEPAEEDDSKFSFVLSPKLAFLYGYLTVSHDNLNEAVKHLEGYTWGVRQLAPLNVILRQQWITDAIEQGEYYQVNIHLNTVNMMGIFYYDFHEIGIVVFMFLWAFLFGILQAAYHFFKGPFSLMILGYVMTPVTLCFFSAWVDSFDLWMFCGVVLIFAFASCVHFKKKTELDPNG